MAKKSKESAKDLAKDLKKLKKAVKEVREQNEKLTERVEELRESQKKSRKEFEANLRDLGSKFEAYGEAGTSLTVRADGSIFSESGDPGEASDDPSDTPKVSADDRLSSGTEPQPQPKATESAKRKAQELGVELTGVKGTGSRDRITVEDVQKAAGKS